MCDGYTRGWRSSRPYVILMIALVVLLFLVPDLALWLPRHMTPAR